MLTALLVYVHQAPMFCRQAVRARALLQGEIGVDKTTGKGLEKAYMFFLAHRSYWLQYNNYGTWITLGGRGYHNISTKRGFFLVRSDPHRLSDTYLISMNPDV